MASARSRTPSPSQSHTVREHMDAKGVEVLEHCQNKAAEVLEKATDVAASVITDKLESMQSPRSRGTGSDQQTVIRRTPSWGDIPGVNQDLDPSRGTTVNTLARLSSGTPPPFHGQTLHLRDIPEDLDDNKKDLENLKQAICNVQEVGRNADGMKEMYIRALDVDAQKTLMKMQARLDQYDIAISKAKFENSALEPPMQMLKHARNVLTKPAVTLHGVKLDKLKRFSAHAAAQVESANLESWLTNKLEVTEDIPEAVRTRLVQMVKGLM